MSEEKPILETGRALERAKRIRIFIEGMIAEVGEHPEVELKLSWRRDTAYHKAEFIKDIQSIANSEIGENQDKYIVIGVEESSREIKGCSHQDFDEASIRQLLESHLDPSPEFEILRLISSAGAAFVVVRIQRQSLRPSVVKREIREGQRLHLAVGQIWTKPGALNAGSTQKRLVASGRELLEMIDVQPRIDAAVSEKISLLLPQIRLEERTRLGSGIISVPVLTSTDEEFESFVEQVLASNSFNQLNIILERLREKTVFVWSSRSAERLSPERVLEIKSADFVPSLGRLVLFGLLLLKFSSPLAWFEKIGDLLVEIFSMSELLGHRMVDIPRDAETASIDSHYSHTVPAVEALIASYLIVGFELVHRNRIEYVRALFPRIIEAIAGPGETWRKKFFFLFWGVTTGWGYPNRRRDLLAVERYSRGDRIEHILGGEEGIRAAVLQCDCLVDWHSFISLPRTDYSEKAGESETIGYFASAFPSVATNFHPNFSHEPLRIVVPLIQKLWTSFQSHEHGYWALSADLSTILENMEAPRRRDMLVRFVKYAERMHNERMFALNRFPFHADWPTEIAERLQNL